MCVCVCERKNKSGEQRDGELETDRTKKISLKLCAPESPEHVLFTVPEKQSWCQNCLLHSLGQSGPSA